ncbi:MAG: hypothetical protein OEX22_07580 [Cyclobacteriaceae bacterium]|nr:hypothetical protein [Cyclobacteriaceae bacterium]
MKYKEVLLELSKKHEELLKDELLVFSKKTTEFAKNIAIISGVISSVFLLYKALYGEGNKEKKKCNSPSGFGRIRKVLIQQASLYVLEASKQKIQDYLNEVERNGNHS